MSLAYTPESVWRNRSEFVNGREEIVDFLTKKWGEELDYRLIKELWAFTKNKIAVRFAYEWQNRSGKWFRSYGNENWEFDEAGYMCIRMQVSMIYLFLKKIESFIGHLDVDQMNIQVFPNLVYNI